MTPVERRAAVLAAIVAYRSTYGFGEVPPHLILAQADLETDGFASARIIRDNNAFGMMQPARRPTLSAGPAPAEPGQAGAFARYNSLEDSVRDYLMRQKYFHIPDTSDPREYVDATVESGYATGRAYGDAWLRIYGEPVTTDPVVDAPAPAPGADGDGDNSLVIGAGVVLLALAVSH